MSSIYTQLKDQPTSLSDKSLLNSVLSKDGPMPLANIWLRALAFILDFILISAIASIIIWKVVLPKSHPSAFGELIEWSRAVITWYEEPNNSSKTTLPKPSKNLGSALTVANEIQLISFWLYFALGESFFSGSSLGKRICRIRSVSTINLSSPPIMTGLVRGGLKTLTLFLFFPIGMIATLATVFFNKRRQMGHDLLCKTAVIDEKSLDLN